MKLFALALASSVDAANVKCNNGDEVEMQATVAKTEVQADLSKLSNWIEENGNYVGTWTTFDESEKASAQREINGQTVRALVLTKTVDSDGCTEKTVDGVTVCIKTGHALTFECAYSLEDQDLEQAPFTVAGSDMMDSVNGVGTLEYKMSVDKTAPTIGDVVTATIKPTNKGLVTATLKGCSIKRDTDVKGVGIIDDLEPECNLGVNIITGQGDDDLAFSWTSFKWTTQDDENGDEVVESQGIKCSIELELTKDVTPRTAGECPAPGEETSALKPSECVLGAAVGFVPFTKAYKHGLYNCMLDCGAPCRPFNPTDAPEFCLEWCKDWDYVLFTPQTNIIKSRCYCYNNFAGKNANDCLYKDDAVFQENRYTWFMKEDATTKPNPNPHPLYKGIGVSWDECIVPKGELPQAPEGTPGV